jgi:DNA-binding transcriptional LysR family regulator
MRAANFDLNLLVALDALLEEESVSRAAERLRVGQPAMSATLSRLRRAFGDPLLVRSGRGLKRSGFSETLQQPLGEILREIDALLQFGEQFDPSTSRRSFTIVASDHVALVLLRGLFERLSVTAPNVGVRVIPVGETMMEDLSRGTVDLAISPSELLINPQMFHAAPLFQDDFVCVTDASNFGPDEEFTVDDVLSLPYLAVQQGKLSSLIDQRLNEAGYNSRNVAMTAQSFVMAPFMLPGTRMYTIVQRRLANLLMAEESFTVRESPIPLGEIHEVMAWSPKLAADPGHTWLRAQITQTALQL